MFAEFYDSLTDNVEYQKRAEYIVNILKKKHNHEMGQTLDLACGTGTLTILLNKMGVDVYGVDASTEMLSVAFQKALKEDLHMLFVCQKMQNLNLYSKLDTCVCTLDSLNHITDEKQFRKAISKVSDFMNKDGLFLFDVNTVYKHREVLRDNTFVYETDEVFCVWQNTPADNDIIEIDLDFFVKEDDGSYTRFSESFDERAYTLDSIKEALSEAGFELEAVYGDMSYEPPKEDEERIIVVARKV